jgi:hypothetical protein
MPNSADHILQAQHNEAFYQVIDKNAYSDWAMTALFYAALHYIDAFLDRVGIDAGGHDQRDKEVRDRKELRPIWPQYHYLKNRSINARYYCGTFTPDQLQQCYGGDLAAIRRSLLRLVNPK